jgi:DNA repair protein RecO (recombination protein O)
MRWVKNATVQNAFEGLRYDAERLFLAAYLSDVAVELTEERTPPGEFYPLILNAFYLLSQKTAEPDKIKGTFEMRAAALSGFCPDLSACAACGALPTENMRLDVMNGALLCPACYAKQTAMGELPVTDLGERRLLLPLTASAAAALHFTVTAEPKRLFSFRLTDERSKRFFGEAAEAYLLHHLERGFSTLQNYKHLQRMGDLCPPPQA